MSIRKRTRKSYGVGQSKLHIKDIRGFCRYEEYREYMSQYEWLHCYTEYEWYMQRIVDKCEKSNRLMSLKEYCKKSDDISEIKFYGSGDVI